MKDTGGWWSSWYKQIMSLVGAITAVGSIAAWVGVWVSNVVFEDEFHSFKYEVYSQELNARKKDLRNVKMVIAHLEHESKPVPTFLIEEKLEVEDDIKSIEQILEKMVPSDQYKK